MHDVHHYRINSRSIISFLESEKPKHYSGTSKICLIVEFNLLPFKVKPNRKAHQIDFHKLVSHIRNDGATEKHKLN